MEKIKNIERVKVPYPSWKSSDVAFIKSVEWSMHYIVMIVYCQLRGNRSCWPDMYDDFFEMKLRFDNVSNLKLDFQGKGLQQTTGFNMLDVSANGLESINYQIEDYEAGIIALACEAIEIMEVNMPVRIALV